jgi:hypothetical protein
MACADYPVCSREGCGRPACDHARSEPHMLYDNVTECPGYEDATGVYAAAFQGGGGGFGGGGASGGW